MVRIPKEATKYKKEHPNVLNANGSVTINDVTLKEGDEFAFLCVRKGNSSWGKMMRNAVIECIRPNYEDEGLTELDITGTSDWVKCELTCMLSQIV
jgi:hypothetical protein